MSNSAELINHHYRIVRELGKGGFADRTVAAPVEIRSNPPSQKPSVPVSYSIKTTQVSFDEGSTGCNLTT